MEQIDQIERGFASTIARVSHTRHLGYMMTTSSRFQERLMSDETLPEKLKTQYAAFSSAVVTEDNRYKKSGASKHTQKLKEADGVQDQKLSGIRAFCEGWLRAGDAEKAAAAEVILAAYKLYGAKTSDRYMDEYVKVNQLVAEMERKADVKSAVKALALTDMVAELKAANQLVGQELEGRTQEWSLTDTSALAKARKATDEEYVKLVQLVNALHVAEETDGYSRYSLFIGMQNEFIRYYKTEVLKKINRSGKQDDDQGGEDDGGEDKKDDGSAGDTKE